MMMNIKGDWHNILKEEMEKQYFEQLAVFVHNEYATQRVFPPADMVFNAFDKCSFEDVKVVIVGQDPYHGEGQANGLCFSVNEGVAFPPSLRNIFKELEADLGISIPVSGNLERWSNQGILMLNATLTVRADAAGSHQGKGWEQFTDAVISSIADLKDNIVFVLWGNYAIAKGKNINRERHCVLTSAHPSPLAAHRGFWGNKHFSAANNYLIKHGKEPINW